MKVGWLHDQPRYIGGAELTMAEFKAAAPEGVEVVDCPPGDVKPGLDVYVVGNCQHYDKLPDGPVVRYHHDVSMAPAETAAWSSNSEVRHVFCSPLQQKRFQWPREWVMPYIPHKDDGLIPPALDLARFEAVANQNHRKGAVCVGRMSHGKGLDLLAEYEEPVDVYSSVPCYSQGNARYLGPTTNVAETLARYERFIFLPSVIEPFGRAVVEAWAAGLQLIVNRNVGARYWIEENPDGLRTAAEDFWTYVTD